jgi:DNA-binding CsgD family transcriptional regulator
MRDVVRRYSRSIYAAPDPQAAIDLLSAAAIELGFDGASFALWPTSRRPVDEPTPPAVLLSGSHVGRVDRSWLADYVRTGMYKADVCYPLCRTAVLPIVWSRESRPEIVPGRTANGTQLHGMEELVRRTGLRGGISVPLQAPGGWFGYCTFSSRQHLAFLLDRRDTLEDHLLGMAYRFYDAVGDRLAAFSARESGLSACERECIALLGIGKTVREIAEICELPYSTVRFHLDRARHKLGARNRAQAVATAAALGLIDRLN